MVSGDPPVISQRSSVAGDVDRAVAASARRPRCGRAHRAVDRGDGVDLPAGRRSPPRAPRGADAVALAGRTSVGPAIGLGFAIAIGVPVAGVLLSISIVALPLGLATLFALVLMYGVGYVAGGYFLGRLILKEPRNRLLAFLVGWGILRVVGIVPVLGGLVSAAAMVYGLGCITVAVFRARRGPATYERPPTTASGHRPSPTSDRRRIVTLADADWQDHRSISVS